MTKRSALPALAFTVLLAFGLPDGFLKVIALLMAWWFLFRPLKRAELVTFVIACVIYTVMNYLALRNGIFAFRDRQFLLMPYHEVVMWGFYLLHFSRVAESKYPKPVRTSAPFWICLLLFAAPYGMIRNPEMLLAATTGVIALALAFYHEKGDLIATLYAVFVGMLFEQLGVHTGRWSYPPGTIGLWGVPFWSLPLWGGSGFFGSRLLRRWEGSKDVVASARGALADNF